MIATHPHFKSIVPNVSDALTIQFKLMNGFCFADEYTYYKRTPPWELSQWANGELERFKIKLEQVDRLYQLNIIDNEDWLGVEMVARLNYEGRHIFVKIHVNNYITACQCVGDCIILISTDADSFMRTVITSEYQGDLVQKSLAEDGIFIQSPTEYDHCDMKFWKSVPNLKYLCHHNIFANQTKLRNYANVLPKILTKSIDDFIKMKSTKKFYDNLQNVFLLSIEKQNSWVKYMKSGDESVLNINSPLDIEY